MEVEMRRIRVAGIAEHPEHLTRRDLVPDLHLHAARLHMRIEGEAALPDIDDDMIARRHLDRRVVGQLAGHLLEQAIRRPNHGAVGDGINLFAA